VTRKYLALKAAASNTVPAAPSAITTLVVRATGRLECDEGVMMAKSTDQAGLTARLHIARTEAAND